MKLHLFSEAETYCFHYARGEGKGGGGGRGTRGKGEGARGGHLTAVTLSDGTRARFLGERWAVRGKVRGKEG